MNYREVTINKPLHLLGEPATAWFASAHWFPTKRSFVWAQTFNTQASCNVILNDGTHVTVPMPF